MIAIDCLRLVANFLSDSKMCAILDKLEEDSEAVLTQAEKQKLGFYLNSLNVAISTISVEEIPLVDEVVVASGADSKIDYSAISARVYEVLEVVDEKTRMRSQFYALPFSLYLPKPLTPYVIKFSYLPAKVKSVFDEVGVSSLVVDSVVAKLMASDILLAKNSYDEASIWKSEYRKAIGAVKLRRKRMCLPYRKFV